MEDSKVKTTGKPGGLWERVVWAWRGAREGWEGGGESHDVASNSPWPHPIPQSRPEPPSRRRDGVGALSRHDLVESLTLAGCLDDIADAPNRDAIIGLNA